MIGNAPACFFCILLAASTAGSKTVQEVFNDVFLNYDKTVRPDHGGLPVDILVEASILDVYNFDEINHEVTLSMNLQQKWIDKRLSFDYGQLGGTRSFVLDSEQAQKMWIPDTYIANARTVIKHDFTKPNEFTRVHYNGSIIRSARITVTVGCVLNLRWFPFDQNICSLDFESYAYSMSECRFLWAKDYNSGKAKIWISAETAESVRHEITAFRGSDVQIESASGNYSRVALELSFKRLSFRYFLDVYFPATAIPVVAFISLCVGPPHFRVLMSTICMFMMVTYAVVFRISHVTVDYKTALDFYVFNSSVTVFNVVLVNFLIYLLKPKSLPAQMRMRQLLNSNEDGKIFLNDDETVDDATTSTIGGVSTSPTAPPFPNKLMENLYKFIEKSYLTMPLFFVVFNIIYWPVVLIGSSGTPHDFIPVESRYP